MTKQIYVLGGGTFSHVRAHMSLAAPAFGETAKTIHKMFQALDMKREYAHNLVLTKMADSSSHLVTNDDVAAFVDKIVADPDTKIIVFNVALTDFDGQIGDIPSGKYAERLKSREGDQTMTLTMAQKVISRIRAVRKDIFLVAFKTTCGATETEQYIAGLNLLKENSVNLVLANDLQTRLNMVIVPEEAKYAVTTARRSSLAALVKMTLSRAKLTYTRSEVVPGDSIDWNSDEIPSSLREVVNYCIEQGAYKPFRGKTAGHFAVKVDDTTFLTSKRSTNFNDLEKIGLVKVESTGRDNVRAYGAKPSVGGMSQRIIFTEHPDVDCIVHFHCPAKPTMATIAGWTRPQYPYECGSHECGQNTSDGLEEIWPGIKAVYLDQHGPNVVFNRNIDPARVIRFINKHFDLSQKTGGPVIV